MGQTLLQGLTPTCDAGGAIGAARCFIPSELLCHPCQRACGGPRSQLL